METLLALEMVRVTEAAALASARFMGRGQKDEADHAATEAMRRTMDEVEMRGTIVIGEGERDEAPMLWIGEPVGTGGQDDVAIDIAVDPLEGTNLVAHGQANAITVLAASEQGGLLHAPDTYLDKLCVGPVAAGDVDIRHTPTDNVRAIARALRRDVRDITIVILERPRHEALIAEVRATGARIKLITDGDLSAAISCAVSGTGVHGVMGIGGAPEGVITAAALKCLGGEIQARFRFRNDAGACARRAHGRDHRTRSTCSATDDLAPGAGPRVRGDRGHARRPPRRGPLLRRRRPHPLAGDGLPVQGGPLPGHGPHVRPHPTARGPAVAGRVRSAAAPSASANPSWPLRPTVWSAVAHSRGSAPISSSTRRVPATSGSAGSPSASRRRRCRRR